MATTAINPTTGLPQSSTPSGRGMEALSSEDFFRLLITELQQQDPLAPAKTGDMINQVAQIRSIEQSHTLNQTLRALQNSQQQAGVSALLGKFVVATPKDASGVASEASGIVTGVRFDADGSAWLDLDSGQTVALVDVKRIMTPEAAELAQLTAGRSTAAAPASGATTETATTAATTSTAPATTAKSVAPAPPEYDLLPWIDLKGSFSL